MKKYIIALIAVISVFSTQAQIRTSRTFTKEKSRTEWMVRAGLSFNRLNGFDKIETEDAKIGGSTGFAVDLGFNRYFKNTNLYWGMELGIGTRGCSFKWDDSDPEYDEKFTTNAVTLKYVPFSLGYKFPVGENLRVDPHAGVYASYDLSHGGDLDDYENDFDLGLQLGIGVWYNRVNLDLMYQFGFVDAGPGGEDPYDGIWESFEGGKTGNILLRLGVSF